MYCSFEFGLEEVKIKEFQDKYFNFYYQLHWKF